MPGPSRYSDEDDSMDDQLEQGAQKNLVAHPRWYRRGPRRIWEGCFDCLSAKRGSVDRARRRRLCRWALIIVVVVTLLSVCAALVYIALVGSLIRRLTPQSGNSGLHHIVSHWREPDSHGAYKYEWRDDFSRNIVPKNCHSHNDYWRRIPLYNALAAGCVGFEADIWLADDNELLVSHSWSSTTLHRTLRTLYLDPLTNILEKRNVTATSADSKEVGIFDSDPTASTVLLVDFKSEGYRTWLVLMEQLQSLRESDWLTYFDGSVLHQGPLTVVGTGNAPFELVQQNTTNRFVFFDAPLLAVTDDQYNTTNSYYASVDVKKAIGSLRFNRLSASQVAKVELQVQTADNGASRDGRLA